MACLNPWDCQSKRLHTIDGVFDCLYAGDGGKLYGVVYLDVYNQTVSDVASTVRTGTDADHTGVVVYEVRGHE